MNGGSTNGSQNGGSSNGESSGGHHHHHGGHTAGGGGQTSGMNSGGMNNGSSNGKCNGETTGSMTTGADTGGGGQTAGETTGATTGDTTGSMTTGADTGGGGQTAGTDTGGGGQTAGTAEPEPEKPKRKIRGRFIPLAYLDMDFSTKPVSLSEMNLSSKKKRDSLSLEPADSSKGYMVMEKAEIEGGIGVGLQLYLINARGFLHYLNGLVGVMPVAGRKTTVLRYAKDLGDAHTRRKVAIPQNVDELENWTTGDVLAYESSGGVVVLAGLGVPYAGVGTASVIQGKHIYQVQKLSDHEVLLSVTKQKVTSVSPFIFAGIGSAFAEMSKTVSQTPAFIFDLSTEKGLEAYQQALHGNLAAAQEYGSHKVEGVTLFSDAEMLSMARSSNLQLGLPIFFNVKCTKGETCTEESITDYISNTKVKNYYTEYVQAKTSGGILSKHLVDSATFKSQTSADLRQVYLNVTWLFEREHSKGRLASWADRVASLNEEVGMPSLSMGDIPSGFVRGELQVNSSLAGVKRLLYYGKMEKNQERHVLENRVVNMVQEYLRKGDSDNLCPAQQPRSYQESCEEKLTKESLKANLKAVEVLGEAEQGFIEKNPSKVALAFRGLGKHILKNRFTVKNYLKWMKKAESVNSSLLLEGENFKRVKIVN